MRNIIDYPKVFISYAWGTEEYQAKVISFASDLMNDGIDVILDRWSLREGNDTYAFMEQSVTDPTITNVLLLLDPNYERKANERNGGVGTETQIISPEIYNQVTQEKFLPVIFERGVNGEIPKPQYLKTMLHFDLSEEDRYDSEYRRLVQRLYGNEIVKKPELGKKPSWVGEGTDISTKTRVKYEGLKRQKPEYLKKEEFISFLESIKGKIYDFNKDGFSDELTLDEYIELYGKTKEMRDDFLCLLNYSFYVPEAHIIVANFIEEIRENIQQKKDYEHEIIRTWIHEIFIYIIATYIKHKDYDALAYMFSKSYFVGTSSDNVIQSFNVFYYFNEHLNNAVSKRDNKKYLSGTANYWINNINIETCSKNEFVLADILCYNASIFVENYTEYWFWFPITYIYGGRQYQNSLFEKFSIKLKSREFLKKFAKIMGYSNIEDFKRQYIKFESDINERKLVAYRYEGAFESAPIVCQIVKSDELGIRN